ncbi:phosphinothricin acetyltransferase [Bacillus pakistanensis]|uniref:Phosphinothricin acetyltransferase n=1 Tax=Rossellomorea pakistanensis TaxID=992288 RepID=A0ABS2N6P9_9BACI|nr:GNAT family N-acetyltransferase [Bacillus pakistanensis]MBM7583532.1 phosphinothricin acetyltransferase [Bacillus pakistanensis]
MNIELISQKHWPGIKEIYQLGVDTGNATFETNVPNWGNWINGKIIHCSVVGIKDDKVAGWATVSAVSRRYVYRGVGEVSVYVHPQFKGKGMGKELLSEVITRSEKNGLWTLQASIFPENKGSIKIFQQKGFRKVGIREKIGKHHGVWRDVLFFERRSEVL